MPSYNITIDDASPLFRYDGIWSDSSTLDDRRPSYANATFHATESQGSKATLDFNGTAVFIYGAKRGNHGAFTIDVDGATEILDGSASPDQFQTLLYSKTGLDPSKEHRVVMTNSQVGKFFDVDYVVATMGDGREGTTSAVQIDDTASNILYGGTWETNGPMQFVAKSFNASYRATKDPNGFVNIPFDGTAVRVYGGTGRNHGMYSVALDQGEAKMFNGSTPSDVEYRGQQLLYMATGLQSGSHVLRMDNLDTSGTLFMDIDFYVQEDWSGPPRKLSGGAMAGIVLACIAPLIICALAFLWIRRRRRQPVSVHSEAAFSNNNTISSSGAVRPFIIIPRSQPSSTDNSPQSSWHTHTTSSLTQSGGVGASPAVWKSLPFSEKRSLPDVGGSSGTMLASGSGRMVFAPNPHVEEVQLPRATFAKRATRPPSYMSSM